MGRTLDKFERIVYLLAHKWALAGLTLLLVYATATLFDGLTRALLSSPIDVVRDVDSLVVAVAISACFPLLILERENIVISFIDAVVGPRGTWILDVVAAILTAAVMAALAWQIVRHASNLSQAAETSALLRIPKGPFWYVVGMNMTFAAVAQIIIALQSIRGRYATFSN